MNVLTRVSRLRGLGVRSSNVSYQHVLQPHDLRHCTGFGSTAPIGHKAAPFKYKSTTGMPLALAVGSVAAAGASWFGGLATDREMSPVHVWRMDFLIKENIMDGFSACPSGLVLSSNKKTLDRSTACRLVESNWANKSEASATVTEDMFVRFVETYGQSREPPIHFYILVHGGQTLEPFVSFITSLAANNPTFGAGAAKVPLALATPRVYPPGRLGTRWLTFGSFGTSGLFGAATTNPKLHTQTHATRKS